MSTSNATTRSTAGFRSGSGIMNPDFEKFKTGDTVNIGSHKVEVVKYIAAGGFAQIYTVKFIGFLNELDILNANDSDSNNNDKKQKNEPKPLKIGDIACLKRVKVTDDSGLNEMKNEIDVMKKLSGSPNIVQYYDSNATKLTNGATGYEVFLLMELCPNKSLLDFMNDRLATKLSVDEISKIMYDITLGLAQMHYLTKPLIHRDIKIENVLVDKDMNFKLADFGSTSTINHIALSDQDIAISTQDIFVHTTPQYRSPEMIDQYRFLPINEISDIWALGVFLYKLLFYITPFEMTGQFAILHGRFSFPDNKYPIEFTNLISAMLMENPRMRPNVYQVLDTICKFKKLETPLFDKYGAGAYNFQLCADFRVQTRDLQEKLLNIEQAHIINGTTISKITDLNTYNEIFTILHEISPKIDHIESLQVKGNIGERKVSDASYLSNNSNGEILKPEMVNTPFNNDNSLTARDNSNTEPAANAQKQFYQSGIDESRTSNDTTYYPSINEINTYADREFGTSVPQVPAPIPQHDNVRINTETNRNSNGEIKANFNMLPTFATQSERNVNTFFPPARYGSIHSTNNRTNIPEREFDQSTTWNNEPARSATTKGKTHKSNNPFPYFKSEINVSDNGHASNNFFVDTTNMNSKRDSLSSPGGVDNYDIQSPTNYEATSPTTYSNNLNPPPNLDNIFASTPNMSAGVIPKSGESRGKQLFRNAVPPNSQPQSQNVKIHPMVNPNPQQQFQFIPQQSQLRKQSQPLIPSGANNQTSKINIGNTKTQNANSELSDLIDFKDAPPLPMKKQNEETIKLTTQRNEILRKPLDLSMNELSLSPDLDMVEDAALNMRRSKSAAVRRSYGEAKTLDKFESKTRNGLTIENFDGNHSTAFTDNDNNNDIMSQESISEMKIPNIKRMIEDDLVSEHSTESIDINMDAARRKSSLLKPNSRGSTPTTKLSTERPNHTRNVSLMSETSDIAPLKNFDDARTNAIRSGRHSLDLKYEEINFTRRAQLQEQEQKQRQLDKSLQGIQKVKTNPQNVGNVKNDIGSNPNSSTTSIDSKNRPLSRVRQSLDIDRLHTSIMLHPKIIVKSSHMMEFVPTVKEKRASVEYKRNFIIEKIEDAIEKMYWMYYINLPYYLMLTWDAYILHTFILTMFSLGVFGVLKYCLMY
ncbi:hypothetical protein C6P45_001626 [Maudiozyma exigua]|uniref:Protein kinase domain-containing protein n=1 Tax=Maudiozyma exigua TaxID=34358 RepID=A0A9P6VZA7_MAUEX|nr:hypothetical protein C6P45_001626 [Kazachstania exigua]